jgi:hypothetical protein
LYFQAFFQIAGFVGGHCVSVFLIAGDLGIAWTGRLTREGILGTLF